MSIFDRFFRRTEEYKWPENVRFGRYTDAYKSEDKYDAWDKALELFEQERYRESFELFFYYLLDESEENVRTWTEDGSLRFEVMQGSKLIEGMVGEKMIKAEAKIARASELSVGLLRRMMELNYKLKYSRYALDPDNHLTLVFDSYLLDGSPYKMYFALKEIAVSADKQDDLLLEEFKSLTAVNNEHIIAIPDEQKRTKLEFIRKKISDALKEYDTGRLSQDQYAGAYGYMFLDLAYRLDYLIKPEGPLTEALERVHRTYFEQTDRSNTAKNNSVRKELEKILKIPDADLSKELYNVSASFGITTAGSYEQLVALIDSELNHMDWYIDNRHFDLALSFPGYIAGYALFNYAFEPPLKDLLHLYYHITEPWYFNAMGFEGEYVDQSSMTLRKQAILSALDAWKDRYRSRYPRLDVPERILRFERLTAFAKSYFLMIKALDLTKAA